MNTSSITATSANTQADEPKKKKAKGAKYVSKQRYYQNHTQALVMRKAKRVTKRSEKLHAISAGKNLGSEAAQRRRRANENRRLRLEQINQERGGKNQRLLSLRTMPRIAPPPRKIKSAPSPIAETVIIEKVKINSLISTIPTDTQLDAPIKKAKAARKSAVAKPLKNAKQAAKPAKKASAPKKAKAAAIVKEKKPKSKAKDSPKEKVKSAAKAKAKAKSE